MSKKKIYMQDLFCLSFDFKMFFFSPCIFGVLCYVFSIDMRVCVSVDGETSHPLVTLQVFFVFYSEGLTEPVAPWLSEAACLSPHPPKLLLEAQQLLQASDMNSSRPNPSPYTCVTGTLPTEPPFQPFSFIVTI